MTLGLFSENWFALSHGRADHQASLDLQQRRALVWVWIAAQYWAVHYTSVTEMPCRLYILTLF